MIAVILYTYTPLLAVAPISPPADLFWVYVVLGVIALAVPVLLYRLHLKNLKNEILSYDDPTLRFPNFIFVIFGSVDGIDRIRHTGGNSPELTAMIERYNSKVNTYERIKVTTIVFGLIALVIAILLRSDDDDSDDDVGILGFFDTDSSSAQDTKKKNKQRKR